MSFLLRILKLTVLTLWIVGIFFTITSVFNNIDPEIQDNIINRLIEEPIQGSAKSFMFVLSYQYVTASIKNEWIGDPDKKTWMLEELPLPDSRDALFLFPVWLLTLSTTGLLLTKETNPFKKAMITLLALIIITVISWILFKTLFYYLMLWTADDLGIAAETLEMIRTEESTRTLGFYGLRNSLLISLGFFIVYVIALAKKRKE